MKAGGRKTKDKIEHKSGVDVQEKMSQAEAETLAAPEAKKKPALFYKLYHKENTSCLSRDSSTFHSRGA